MKDSQIQKADKVKNFSTKAKYLMFFSIMLPLLILICTAFAYEKQRLLKMASLFESQLIIEVSNTLSALQRHIQNSKIQLDYHYTWQRSVNQDENTRQRKKEQVFYKGLEQLKHSKLKFFNFTDLILLNDSCQSKRTTFQIFNREQIKKCKEIQQSSKSWFQIADKIVFSINLVSIDQKQQPLSHETLEVMQKSIANEQMKGLLNKIFANKQQSSSILNKKIQINIVLKSAHISELDQNSRKKVQTIFDYQKFQAQKKTKSSSNSNQQIDFYAEQILNELQNSNKGQQCIYYDNYTECKEFSIFLLYDSVNQLKQMSDTASRQSDFEYKNEHMQQMQRIIDERVNNLGYWSRQDNSISLITFYPFTEEQGIPNKSQFFDLQEINRKMMFSLLNQIIYQSLEISPLILLTQDSWHFDYKDAESYQKIQDFIHQFIELNLLYKTKHSLEHIYRILSVQSPIYESNSQQKYLQILNLLNQIQNYQLGKKNLIQGKIFISNPITKPMINSLNKFDPFPSDYIIGALIPIAIILVYPLIGWLRMLFI